MKGVWVPKNLNYWQKFHCSIGKKINISVGCLTFLGFYSVPAQKIQGSSNYSASPCLMFPIVDRCRKMLKLTLNVKPRWTILDILETSLCSTFPKPGHNPVLGPTHSTLFLFLLFRAGHLGVQVCEDLGT